MADIDPNELLPESDRDYLVEKGFDCVVTQVGDAVHVVLRGFELPDTYRPHQVSLRIILPAGYPNADLDMFWTLPNVELASGAKPDRADVFQEFEGEQWQRWSRHFTKPWRQGVDDLRTFLATIRQELARGV